MNSQNLYIEKHQLKGWDEGLKQNSRTLISKMDTVVLLTRLSTHYLNNSLTAATKQGWRLCHSSAIIQGQPLNKGSFWPRKYSNHAKTAGTRSPPLMATTAKWKVMKPTRKYPLHNSTGLYNKSKGTHYHMSTGQVSFVTKSTHINFHDVSKATESSE